MSQKDSVSSQDFPAVLRALGTLALAAATAVAIKWFFSRDKEEKEEGKESKFQCTQEPVEDGPKGILENNTKEPQVSDEQGLKVLEFDCSSHGLLKSSVDTSCPKIAYMKGDGECLTDHKRLVHDVALVSSKLNNVDGAQCTVHDPEDAYVSISGFPATIMNDNTYDTQNPVFSSCFTQTSYERSKEQQVNTESSSNGECTNVMSVEYPGCKSQTIGGGNMASGIWTMKHKAVNVSLDNDLFNMNTREINGNYNCESDINNANHTKPCNDTNDNLFGSNSHKNTEGNTKERIREDSVHACAPDLPEPQESVGTFMKSYSPLSYEVLTKHHNTKQRTIYTTFNVQDILQTVDIIQEAKQIAITTSNNDTVLTNSFYKGHCQDEKFHFTYNNHTTYTRQSSIEHKTYATSDNMLEEANENLKSSIVRSIPASMSVPEVCKDVDEKNGKFFSPVNTLYNDCNGKHDKELISRDLQISGGSQSLVELRLPKADTMEERKITNTISHHTNHVLQWNTTTVYNSTEYIDLMYPLDVQGPETSITRLKEKVEGQSDVESSNSPSTEKSVSMSTDRESNNSDADVESSLESSTSYNITQDEPNTVTREFLCDTTTLNTSMVTNTESQSIRSTRDKQDNDVFYNWHMHDANFVTMDKKEFCAVITNGYLSRYQKQVDTNNFACTSQYKPGECLGENQQTAIANPYSNLLENTVMFTEELSSWSPFSSTDDQSASYVTMDISEPNILDTTQAVKKDPYLSEEDMTVGELMQTSDSLLSSSENLDNTDPSSNDACSEQGSVPSCISSPSHNEEDKNHERLDTVESDDQPFSRERIMSAIAETQSLLTSERKKPLMTKSCDNIYSGPSRHRSALKSKAQSMLCLLTEYYTTKLHSLENGPLEEVARGCFIRIPKGFHNIGEGVRFQLTLGNCLELLKIARKNSVPELLKAVYTLISDNYLNVLKNSAIYGQLTGSEREKILQLRMRGKLSLCIIETQSIFGLNKNISRSEDTSPDQSKNQLYSLDMESNQWSQVTNIPEEACLKGCSICSMHNYLFIAGGIQKGKNSLCSSKLFCYNPLTDIWIQLAPMNQARSQLKLVPLDGYLYAIGGECLHTMERYDPRSNKWTFVASLPKGSFAVAHEAAACGGEIYISGGHLFYRLLKYNPGQDQWEECPFNASKGRSCDMVAVGHILYRFDMHKDSTVHILKYNTTAKVWSEYTTTFPNSKVPFRCAVLDGTIYCLNRETAARFSVEEVMFESTMFSKVPTKGIGYPCPVVLNLQGSLSQTSV
ncbi:uncharacterized protein RB166_019152 [Leptodactylus fuscus]